MCWKDAPKKLVAKRHLRPAADLAPASERDTIPKSTVLTISNILPAQEECVRRRSEQLLKREAWRVFRAYVSKHRVLRIGNACSESTFWQRLAFDQGSLSHSSIRPSRVNVGPGSRS